MMFSQYIKNKVVLNPVGHIEINIDKIYAQYNPDRFKFYKSLHDGPEKEVLNMKFSPHVRFLGKYRKIFDIDWRNIENDPYYKMHVLYGKKKNWIQNKIKKFMDMYIDIKDNGFNYSYDNIIVVEKPIIGNPYNDNFEIFEGHHRVAILNILGIKCLFVDLVRAVCI